VRSGRGEGISQSDEIVKISAHLDRERHVRRGRDARIGPRVCLCFAFEFLKNLADG
jgi:hypothetical protein